VFRLYVVYMISNITIKPQLSAIYRTLQRLAIEYVQDELPDSFGVIKVVQHVSPACRVAKLKVSDNLAAGQILRQIDDRDISNFRQASHLKLPVVLFTVVAIPVLVGFLNDSAGDITLDTVLPSAFSMLILAHCLLWQMSPLIVVLPYAALLVIFLSYGYVFRKVKKRVGEVRAQSEANRGMKSLAGWHVRHHKIFDEKLTYAESFGLYVTGTSRRYWKCGVDALATVVYYMGRRKELRMKIAAFFHSFHPKRHSKRQWQVMNMPDFLHGRVVNPKFAKIIEDMSAAPPVLPELPSRIDRMTKDVAARWDIQRGHTLAGGLNTSTGKNSENASHGYLQRLLCSDQWALLAPQPMTAEESEAQVGHLFAQRQGADLNGAGNNNEVASRFREKFGFCRKLGKAIRRTMKSYQDQMNAGIYFIIYLFIITL
jgi:hypothetical protein